MDSTFDYSQSCWEKIRKNFDSKFSFLFIEKITEMKYAIYLDNDLNEHIVTLFNSNEFDKSIYNRDLKELHSALNNLKSEEKTQIHIVCTDYICSNQYRGYYHAQVQKGIKYYHIELNFFEKEIPPISDITNLLMNYTDYNKFRGKKSSNDDYDQYSESNIMRDLMNGEGEKHGFD